MLSKFEIHKLRSNLLDWFAYHRRDLPWRRTRDPYAIWISEIMLQQTRVTAAIPYYRRFLARFPDIHSLADAPEPELLAHWAGLGYYYRARNLQKAARIIRDAGGFPGTYEGIRRLPGVGDYTAAAVASIGFNLPHAALDGNVLRVLSRIFDDATDIGSLAGRRHFTALAGELLDRKQAGVFNQAMMEIGATVCLPKKPQCLLCPISASCQSRTSGRQNELPVKLAGQKKVRETRILLWIERGGRLLVWQRPADSRLMPGFWELPEQSHLRETVAGRMLGRFRHTITFHHYLFEVAEASEPAELAECQWMPLDRLNHIPASTILRKAKRAVEKRRKESILVRLRTEEDVTC